MPKICVVYLNMVLQPQAGTIAFATICAFMCVNVASSPFLMLCRGLRWPMIDPSRVIAWISAMSLLPYIVATLQTPIIWLSLECVSMW